MKFRRMMCSFAVSIGLVSFLVIGQPQPPRPPDVPYVPTPHEVVAEMLRMANVGKDDIVYDLGCGDGRIVIAAVKDFGAKKGVGVDIDPNRVKESNENAKKAGVTEKVRFFQKDLFETNFSEATVVTLYLLQTINLKLRPYLFRQLRPGTRVVSHDFDMEEWKPDKMARVRSTYREHSLYYWIIPAGVAGTWRWSISTPVGQRTYTLQLRQRFQKVSGVIIVDGREAPISDAKLTGDQLSFTVTREIRGQKTTIRYSGRVNDDTIKGSVEVQGGAMEGKREWTAKRDKVNLVGTWRWTVKAPEGQLSAGLRIERKNGKLFATYLTREKEFPIPDFYAWGAGVYFTVSVGVPAQTLTYDGVVEGNKLTGTLTSWGREVAWIAQRD